MAGNYSEDALLTHLRELADDLDRSPTTADVDERGMCAANTYKRRFGSWNAALEAAGLPVARERNVEDVSLLQEISRLAGELGRAPVAEEMRERGSYGTTVYRERFGSWGEALAAAGYKTRGAEPRRSQNVDFLREHGPATLGELPGDALQVTDRMLGAARLRVTVRGGDGANPSPVCYLVGEHDRETVVHRFLDANPELLERRSDGQLVGLVGRQGGDWKEPARKALESLRDG